MLIQCVKQMVLYIVFFYIVFIFEIDADVPVIVLQNRLKQINNFYARFDQKVTQSDSNVLLESHGELWIKRPNLFHWHLKFPEESFLISDGETFWLYVPSIKQVTAYWLRNISDNVFFMLFTNIGTHNWNNYTVLQQGDVFSIKPIVDNINFKECKINITDCGLIKRFSICEETGQCVDCYLLDQNNNLINVDKFNFILSRDIQLDEQRQ